MSEITNYLIWTYNTIGKCIRLIIGRLLVQVQLGSPLFKHSVNRQNVMLDDRLDLKKLVRSERVKVPQQANNLKI